jgi:hypothetical protein
MVKVSHLRKFYPEEKIIQEHLYNENYINETKNDPFESYYREEEIIGQVKNIIITSLGHLEHS